MKRIVVVGGGFGGLQTALGLEERLRTRRNVELVIVNDEAHFSYTPLLPHVASGALQMKSIIVRLSSVLGSRFRVVTRPATGIDLKARVVRTDGEDIAYDILVMAVGSDNGLTTRPELQSAAIPLKTVRDAMRIKSRVLAAFNRATRAPTRGDKQRIVTFVIAGGGQRGVELAAELASGIRSSLLPRVDPELRQLFRLIVVEAREELLVGMDRTIADTARDALHKLEVEVVTSDPVVAADDQSVTLASGDAFGTETLLWCCGTAPHPWLAETGLPLLDSGRIAVDRHLSVSGLGGVFALGDCAEIVGNDLPMVPQVAAQQGPIAASNVVADLVGSSFNSFRYLHIGDLLSLGELEAVSHLGVIKLSGLAGWAVFRAAHMAMAPTLTKKLAIFADWTDHLVRGRDFGRLTLE